MASWLKMESSTPDKPEVLAITVKMGWDDPDLTVGKLFRVWNWFDQHTIDGNAIGVTAALLDRIVGVTGFTQAMSEVGWLVMHEDGLSLPNFDRHNGSTAKKRAVTAKRVANYKASLPKEKKGNAKVTPRELPREEKNRKDITDTKVSGNELPKDILWTAGVELYANAGIKEQQARAMIGKLIKDYGEDITLEALYAALEKRAVAPFQYMEKVCQSRIGQKAKGQQSKPRLADKNYMDGVKEDGTVTF